LNRTHALVLTPTALLILACGGLQGGPSADASAEAALDAEDPAEVARKAANYQQAETILNARLNANNADARSWRLLGDVNYSRGQRYGDVWKENLGRAREKYANALRVDPENCVTWGRMATALVAAQENEATRAAPDEIAALPLAEGWAACGGPVMVAVEFARQPTADELAAARRQADRSAGWAGLQAAAAPWQVAAMQRGAVADLDWTTRLVRPEPAPGGVFVVLDFPVSAQGVDGAKARGFDSVEWLTIGSVRGDQFVFRDKRFPERVPSVGRVKATACPGTSWTFDGPDRAPVGNCVAGTYDRSASPVYDPDRLRVADGNHYHQPSIDSAVISWDDIAEDSVVCSGGGVGRQFELLPSCQVSYDRAIPQTRAISSSVGLMAFDVAHAEKMARVLNAGALYGDERAKHLGRNEVAVGMSYTEFAEAWPDLKGCMGRGVYNKTDIIDGGMEFTCELGDWRFQFRDLALIAIDPK
jgi:hypothetical protein